ncbi:MAG: YihY family inner membrane protein, partial [Gammaproteobacteria bacterium]|nr:YihY family inner membrane protein [Gammaproteobacteria bacterium]
MMKAKMEWIGKFLKYLAHRFAYDNLSNIAAMLTLTSLLALIPLLAVIFSILSAIPYVQNLVGEFQVFIFNNFMPSYSEELEQTVRGFINKASNMKTLGFSSLVVTAVMLLRTVDTGFNQIWRTKHKRKAIMAFLIYWMVLILGPLLLGLSIVLTSYFTSLLVLIDAGNQISA